MGGQSVTSCHQLTALPLGMGAVEINAALGDSKTLLNK